MDTLERFQRNLMHAFLHRVVVDGQTQTHIHPHYTIHDVQGWGDLLTEDILLPLNESHLLTLQWGEILLRGKVQLREATPAENTGHTNSEGMRAAVKP